MRATPPYSFIETKALQNMVTLMIKRYLMLEVIDDKILRDYTQVVALTKLEEGWS